MLQPSNASRSFWLTILSLTFIANVVAVRLSYLRWSELGVDLSRSVWGILFATYLGMIVVCVWLFILIVRFGGLNFHIPSNLKSFKADNQIVRALGWVVFLAVLILIPYVKFTFQIGRNDKNPLMDAVLMRIIYYWMCWYALLLAMTALKVALKTTWQAGFASALVLLKRLSLLEINFSAYFNASLSCPSSV